VRDHHRYHRGQCGDATAARPNAGNPDVQDYGTSLKGATWADRVRALLRSCAEAILDAYAVGKVVGSLRNVGVQLITPLA